MQPKIINNLALFGTEMPSLFLAQKLLQENDLEGARVELTRLIDLQPDNSSLWTLLGKTYKYEQDVSNAMQCFNMALSLDPKQPILFLEIGKTFLEAGDPGSAYKSFQMCLALEPNSPDAHFEIGVVYDKIQQVEKARNAWKSALDYDKTHRNALNALGVYALQKDGDPRAASRFFKTAFKKAPDDMIVYNNLVCAYQDMGEHSKVEDLYKKVKRTQFKKTSFVSKHQLNFTHSITLLANGKTKEGWKLWNDRTMVPGVLPFDMDKFSSNRLKNINDANGKKILVLREQGIGDQFWLLGFLKKFQEKANCEIMLDVEPRLTSVLTRSFEKFQVFNFNPHQQTDADYWIAYGDLPSLLNCSRDTDNLSQPYISADEKLVNHWDSILPDAKLRIGISWRSGNLDVRRIQYYSHLTDWADLFSLNDTAFICLQYGDISEDLDRLPRELRDRLYIPDFDLMNDFENLNGVMTNCDFIIGPGSAPMRQASALGKDTLIYVGKGDRWSLGQWLKHDEYNDIAFKNQRYIVFKQDKIKALVNRVRGIIGEKLKLC